jgi:hypothetical protein
MALREADAVRYFKVIVRPDPSEADTVQGYIEAEGEAAARAALPELPGLMLFDHSEKMRVEGCGEEWTAGRHIIERARKAQGNRSVRERTSPRSNAMPQK